MIIFYILLVLYVLGYFRDLYVSLIIIPRNSEPRRPLIFGYVVFALCEASLWPIFVVTNYYDRIQRRKSEKKLDEIHRLQRGDSSAGRAPDS